jgi:hypothetical protein
VDSVSPYPKKLKLKTNITFRTHFKKPEEYVLVCVETGFCRLYNFDYVIV